MSPDLEAVVSDGVIGVRVTISLSFFGDPLDQICTYWEVTAAGVRGFRRMTIQIVTDRVLNDLKGRQIKEATLVLAQSLFQSELNHMRSQGRLSEFLPTEFESVERALAL